MSANLRPARPESDIPRIVELINAVEHDPVTDTQVQQWFEHLTPGRITHRMVATNPQDVVTGYSVIVHETWAPPGQFYVWVVVDPSQRGQGMGAALYAEAEAFLRAQGAASLKSEVRDDCAESLEFAKRRGFSIDRHLFESILDLAAFDDTPYQALQPTLEAAGIRFLSLADFHDSPEARLKLYELNRVTGLDIPGSEDTFMPFSDFEQWICGADWYRPEGQLIAVDGETWVGLSAVRLLPDTQGAYNLMTGVIRPYRGRQIACALKLNAIRYARTHQAVHVRTHNDSLNAPMLAINRKLGYQPQPGKYILRGTLI